MTTLADLIAEYDANAFFYMDRGNGAGWGERGELADYDQNAAAVYGPVEMHLCIGHVAGNGQELSWISDWIGSNNGYSFRLGF